MKMSGQSTVQDEPCVGFIAEKYPGYFEKPELVYPFVVENFDGFSDGDGFPEVMSLKDYYDVSGDELQGCSLFSYAFDKLQNKLVKEEIVTTEVVEDKDVITQENDFRISQMTEEEIAEARTEILERLKPTSIEFLMSKKKVSEEKAVENISANKKVSAFRRERIKKETGSEFEVVEPLDSSTTEMGVKNLEFFDPNEAANEEEGHRYSRLAVNAVQMDLALKSYALMSSRPMHAWINLFDKLEKTILTDSDDLLVHQASSSVDKIRNLYLEEYVSTDKISKWQFSPDVNPTTDGCWVFVPIRRVINIITDEARTVNKDDLEIVELTYLFSIWLLKKQETLVEMFSTPSDIAIHVAETFLIGPEIFSNSIIERSMDIWINSYLIPKGLGGKLSFSLTKPVAKLDAFMPFYSHLINNYKEYGGGEDQFFKMLLIMSSMNTIPHDSIQMLQLLFNPMIELVRQVNISVENIQPILDHNVKMRKDQQYFCDGPLKDCLESYIALLNFYCGILYNEFITKERNPGVFMYAFTELNGFLKYCSETKAPDETLHMLKVVEKTIKTIDKKD